MAARRCSSKEKTTCPGRNTALHAGHHRPTIPMGTSTADILRQILARLLRHRSTLVYTRSCPSKTSTCGRTTSTSLCKSRYDFYTPAGNPVIPPRSSVNHHLRPWTDAEDHELVTFKSDTRARPAWKTIGLRWTCDPEACKARWQILRQNMLELNSRTKPEAEAKD